MDRSFTNTGTSKWNCSLALRFQNIIRKLKSSGEFLSYVSFAERKRESERTKIDFVGAN